MEGQDWAEVRLNARPKRGESKASQFNAALREGNLMSEKRFGAGTNKKDGPGAVPSARKLDEEHEAHHIQTVPLSLARRIQQARQQKGWTQAQLAQAIGEKPKVVNDYERSAAIPNPQQITRMERALGVRLRDGKAHPAKK
ncbi:hypothetical protein CDCA_CDCA08G2321 [Cyanidium caldarium]|uniref:HTH cro/C1-type domain-containing protein n=1 Tax=Cyanidium caldarium TaxID=2771 RepID=A0AAV9IW14_CYACA|nr:hypothetical protein CDCA_CDCA08G2321 [Cyanidium caldarium]